MNYIGNDYVERRMPRNRRDGFDRRIGLGNGATPDNNPKSSKRGNKDRRAEDRRKHCMHCGMSYSGGPASKQVCTCRANALRGAADIL